MYFYRTPAWLQLVFPGILWKVKTSAKEIYLTFDDGPVPEATPWVLAELAKYNAKATFFMVGDNIAKHPEVFTAVVNQGHTVGNHTYNHLPGRQVGTKSYIENVAAGEKALGPSAQKLFRPPYGRLRWGQYQHLKKQYKIVMWDVLSGDFDEKLTAEECRQRSIANTTGGSIIVFHDSRKTIARLKFVLPEFLAHFATLGYSFKSL